MVTLREGKPEDAPGITRVHIDTWKFSYRGLVKEDYLQNLSYEKALQTWEKSFEQKDPVSFIFVAVDQISGIVGFIRGGLPRDQELDYEGEVYAIYIAPSWQERGIGRLLLKKAELFFLEQGKNSFYLWTLASSKSRRFYEACHGEWKHQKIGNVGGGEYELAGYVWDLKKLGRKSGE